jgi:hypothetical protein
MTNVEWILSIVLVLQFLWLRKKNRDTYEELSRNWGLLFKTRDRLDDHLEGEKKWSEIAKPKNESPVDYKE